MTFNKQRKARSGENILLGALASTKKLNPHLFDEQGNLRPAATVAKTDRTTARAETVPSARDTGPAPELERCVGTSLGKAVPIQKDTNPEFLVCLTSIQHGDYDDENLCSKFHTDVLRKAGAIRGDQRKIAHVKARQLQVSGSEPQRTIIEVYRLREPRPEDIKPGDIDYVEPTQ